METETASSMNPTAAPAAAPGALMVLRSCSRVERRAVKSLARHQHADRGEAVCEAGEFADELFVILNGAVVVQAVDRPVCRLGAGDGFGEMAPLARTPRRETVVALAPTELLVFRRVEFAALLERAPRVGRALLRAASTRLRPYATPVEPGEALEMGA